MKILNLLIQYVRNIQNSERILDGYAAAEPDGVAIHPQYFVSRLNKLAAEDAIFTFDVGTPVIWTARHLKTNGKRRILGSYNHGSMANAMMHAIGAQNACPNRQVISLSGDGGFTMMMGEMLTLKQLNLPIKSSYLIMKNLASLQWK